jgi:hypothetical protein
MRNTDAAGLERMVADLVERVERRYYGKYRGLVVDNADPAHLGRLRLRVPSVLGPDVVTGWATPCVPYGGAADQGMLFVPDPKAGVWVEFEEGDLEFPLWVGTFWSSPAAGAELPTPVTADGSPGGSPQDPPTGKLIRTAKGHTLQFEDAEGRESVTLLEKQHGHRIRMDADGITVQDGHGNRVVLADGGITVTAGGGRPIVLDAASISLGRDATEHLVLGDALQKALDTLLNTLSTHTHTGNLGAPTSPPTPPPFQVKVPVSTKHKVL